MCRRLLSVAVVCTASVIAGVAQQPSPLRFAVASVKPGTFNIELSWADVPLNDAQDPRPSLAHALEDQLGLTLRPAKGMADVLVVDRIERPTPN